MPCDAWRKTQTCEVRAGLLSMMNEAGCEAGQLTSLLAMLASHLDDAPDRIDVRRSVEEAADVGRIARDLAARLLGMMDSAEENCAALEIRSMPAPDEVSEWPPGNPA